MFPSSPGKKPKTDASMKQITACYLITLAAIAFAQAATKPWGGRCCDWRENTMGNDRIVL